MPKKINEVGNKYGRLTVIEESAGRKNGRVAWKCLCDCGNYIIVTGTALRNGNTKSCGCIHKESAKKIGESNKGRKSEKIIDEINNRYGKLLVIDQADCLDGQARWLCQCDCGNQIIVKGKYLRNGDTCSCGCLKSKGEEKIKNLLLQANIPFETEKIFPSLILPSGFPARFDFFVNNKYIIEFDGIQHFKNTGWKSHNLISDQERDRIKNLWAKENRIPIIRIKYTQLESIKLEDLLLETSAYILNKEG